MPCIFDVQELPLQGTDAKWRDKYINLFTLSATRNTPPALTLVSFFMKHYKMEEHQTQYLIYGEGRLNKLMGYWQLPLNAVYHELAEASTWSASLDSKCKGEKKCSLVTHRHGGRGASSLETCEWAGRVV